MNKDVFRKLRQMLMEELDLSRELSDKEILDVIDELILNQIKDVRLALKEKVQLRQELFYSVRKLDVLQELVDDETVTEIMVNGPDTIFVERAGKLMKWHKSFTSAEKLEDVIQQIVGKCNRVINESMPIVDARLENGSRVNAVIYPVALNGPILTIRRFPEHPITMEKLIALGSITQECAEFLEKLVKARYSMVIGGGTGSGKTTFLAAMSEYIPKDERLITIEDNAELRIRGIDNLVRLEAKMANMEGAVSVTIRDLIKSALRMRPDRIIVGEVRGGEAMDMLQALNTGHEGSLSTAHANSARDALPMNRSKIGSILNYDLEFSGGTASTITFKDDQKVNDSLEKQVVKAYEKVSKSTSVQSQKVKANNQMVVKSVELNLSQRKQIENTLKKDYKVKSVTTENISSTISNEMQRDAFISVVISAICMLIYIAIRFKDVKFGSSAIIALINDVLVVFAAYSVGRLSVGGTFIACMLTIIGYSINSTIVIFDRIRENLKLQTIRTRDDIKALVNQSISSTLVRTINTSLTTFVMVLALFICGVSSLREFALALMVGVIGGAFSSVFLTGPLWYMMKTRIGSDVIKENQAASQAQPEKITANPNRKKKKKKKRK